MSTQRIIGYRHARKKYLEAKKWMDKYYNDLPAKKATEAFFRFQIVSNKFDEAFSILTIEEKEHERKKEKGIPPAPVLLPKKDYSAELPF